MSSLKSPIASTANLPRITSTNSDGITDANSPSGDFFGEDRLCGTVVEANAQDAKELCEFIFTRVEDFQSGAEQYDDMAVLVLGMDSND